MATKRTDRALAAPILAAILAGALLAACAKDDGPGPPGGSIPTGAQVACPGSALIGVYHPARLHVLKTCRWYWGTVSRVRHEEDGDYHVNVTPDPGFQDYLDDRNRSDQYGALVTEIMPGQRLAPPEVGVHVAVFGTWVLDTEHGWNEIHPVWAIVDLGRGTLTAATPPASPLFGGFDSEGEG
jgi:hypothetical protein